MEYSSSSAMRTARFLFAIFVVTALSAGFWAEPGHAADKGSSKRTTSAVRSSAVPTLTTVADSFKQDFPNVKFTNVLESGIEGIYEVIMGTNIVYYAPAAHKVISGDLFDTDGLNVTASKREILRALQDVETAKLIDTLPLDKAIKIGSGQNIVIEFTDIDCPYCRKVEEFFKNRDDITRYVFLLPLDQIHPMSAAKSKEVLCAKDPAMAYGTAMGGGFDKAELKGCGGRDKEIEEALSQSKAAAGTMGVDGTPVMWVNRNKVTGADTRKIEENLISKATGTAAASGS